MPCSAKRWTGERYECSLVAQLKLEDRIAFAEKLLFEWRMAVRSNSTPPAPRRIESAAGEFL